VTALGLRSGLVVSAALAFAIYDLVAIGVAHPVDLFLSWAVDACASVWLWTLSEGLARRGGRGGVLAGMLFYPLFYFSFACTFAHTFYFESAAERRFSLLDLDLGSIEFFFVRVLPTNGWLVLLVLLAVVHAGALLLRERPRVLSRRALLGGLSAATLLTVAVGTQAERVPSPLVDIARDFWELWTLPRVARDRAAQPAYPLASLDKSARSPLLAATPFKKVFVFVMETMTSARLEAESARIEPNSFFRRERQHLHRYGRYYPNNQDSRTGMLDMLMSRLIPYEAYTEDDCEHYTFLARKPSLVDRFNALGYQSAYALSQSDVELVVGDLAWKRVLHPEEAEVRANAKRFQCVVAYEFEHGCEDLALLPKVLDFIDQNERVFVYQEMIWGHAIEYNQASGKTNTEYYSAYLDALIAHLRRTGVLDQTLIVITSDHGFRDKVLQADPDVYHVPLFFYSTRFEARDDDRLFSHLDFKDILFDELALRSPAEGDPFVMTVGPTSTSMLAVLTDTRDFMLLKRRGHANFLLRHQNLKDASRAPDPRQPAAFMRLFDDYRASFDRWGRAR
jgi:hypothetical protein